MQIKINGKPVNHLAGYITSRQYVLAFQAKP
jgi:hypothetical protein